MLPTATIIIPHFDDTIRLGHCLAALSPQLDGRVEVIVVDNNSTQPLDDLRGAHPGVRFVTEMRRGAALARNRGVAEARTGMLFFLDADCIPAANWVAVALGALPRPDAQIIGGAIDMFDETPPPRSGAEAFERVFAFDYKDYIERKGFSVTANLLTSKAVFVDVGDFIDGLSEDAEWCFRARSKGYRLKLDEGLRVSHPTRSDWPALVRKWRRIAREMFALHQAAGDGPLRRLSWALRALAMGASAAAHLPKVARSARLDTPGERMRAAGTLVRLRLLRAGWMLRQALGLPI